MRTVIFSFPVLIFMLTFSLFSCAGTPEPAANPEGPTDREQALAEAVKGRIRIASPETLREAMSVIRQEGFDRTAQGVELFYVADRLLRSAYPYEIGQESLPTEPGESIFPALFSEALAGEYPSVGESEASFITLLVSALSLLDAPQMFESERGLPAGAERAAATAEQLVALNSATVLPRYLLGRYHEGLKEGGEARGRYGEALEAAGSAGCYPAVEGLARIAFSEGAYAESAELRGDLLERYPGRLELELQTIEAYLAAGMLDEADSLLADMIRNYPENAMVVGKRPLLLEQYGRYEQAGRLAEALERTYGETPDILLVNARLLMQRNRVEESVSLLEKGSKLFGSEPFYNAMYERTLIESGNTETARRLLEQNRGGQTSAAATEALLKQAIAAGQWETASEYLEALPEADRLDPRFLSYGIAIAENRGDTAGAVEYARALAERSGAAADRIRLAGVLIGTGTAAARNEAARTIDALPASELSAGERSMLYYQKSRLASGQEKLELLRSALLEDLRNTDALIAIARLYRERGELKNSYRYFSQAAALLPENREVAEELKDVEMRLAGNEGPVGTLFDSRMR